MAFSQQVERPTKKDYKKNADALYGTAENGVRILIRLLSKDADQALNFESFALSTIRELYDENRRELIKLLKSYDTTNITVERTPETLRGDSGRFSVKTKNKVIRLLAWIAIISVPSFTEDKKMRIMIWNGISELAVMLVKITNGSLYKSPLEFAINLCEGKIALERKRKEDPDEDPSPPSSSPVAKRKTIKKKKSTKKSVKKLVKKRNDSDSNNNVGATCISLSDVI